MGWRRVSLIVVPVLGVVLYVCELMGFFVDLHFNAHHCFLIKSSQPPSPSLPDPFKLVGTEDIVHLSDNIFLISSGDLERTFGGFPPTPGRIWILQLPDPKLLSASSVPHVLVRSRPLVIQNYPPIPFQPHGVYYSRATQLLYAVSHGLSDPTAKANGNVAALQSRIVILKVNGVKSEGSGIASQADDLFSSCSLSYVRSITSPLFGRAAINDVIEGEVNKQRDEYELFVTEWLQYEFPVGGKRFPANSSERLSLVKQNIAEFVSPGARVFRCVFQLKNKNEKVEPPSSCNVAAGGFYMANGITKHVAFVDKPTKEEVVSDGRIFVNDVSKKQIIVMRRDPANPSHLIRTSSIHLTYMVDNIEWDGETGRMYAASMPLTYQILQRLNGERIAVAGGLTVISPSSSGASEWDVSESSLMSDGSVLSMLSSAFAWRGWVLLGSPFDEGVLVCPPTAATTFNAI